MKVWYPINKEQFVLGGGNKKSSTTTHGQVRFQFSHMATDSFVSVWSSKGFTFVLRFSRTNLDSRHLDTIHLTVKKLLLYKIIVINSLYQAGNTT